MHPRSARETVFTRSKHSTPDSVVSLTPSLRAGVGIRYEQLKGTESLS
jgi:hypothetical protein